MWNAYFIGYSACLSTKYLSYAQEQYGASFFGCTVSNIKVLLCRFYLEKNYLQAISYYKIVIDSVSKLEEKFPLNNDMCYLHYWIAEIV